MAYKDYSTYSAVQGNINYLYGKSWVQPNAFYPTLFGYTGVNATAHQTFLKGLSEGSYTSFDALIAKEKEVADHLVSIKGEKLALIQSVDGLSYTELPFEKKGGVLGAKKYEDSNSEITIKMALDDNFQILPFIKEWQNFWFIKNSSGIKFMTHTNGNGEGYLGFDNLYVSPDGSIKRLSHLSLFGLIPTKLKFLSNVGPTLNAGEIQVAELSCLYSHGVFSFPNPNESDTPKVISFFLK